MAESTTYQEIESEIKRVFTLEPDNHFYTCPECGKAYKGCHKGLKSFEWHLNNVHGIELRRQAVTQIESVSEMKFIDYLCQLCGRDFPTEEEYKQHLELEHDIK